MALPSSQAPAQFYHQEKTSIGGTALQLSATAIELQVGIEIRADAANGANFIYVGKSTVTAGGTDTTDGFKLAAGERVFVAIDDVSKVWVIGSTTGLAVTWIAS